MFQRKRLDAYSCPGLYIIPDVWTKLEEEQIISDIINDNSENICYQIHKAKEFGWKFIPVQKKAKEDYLGDFPQWLKNIWNKIADLDGAKEIIKDDYPDHVLVNFYPVGDGCNSHTDDINFWNEWVIGASLGSGCNMNFCKDGGKPLKYWIPPRSIYMLTKDARYLWRHGIDFSEKDIFYGDVIKRTERFSITFRTIHSKFLSDDLKKMKK